ncbi:hypothetical protein MHU86_24011 [Fragilaria crotonensis]|nr:hypothetical protein MHU86_24011 [Fragilaria crotonensis]
MPEEQHPEERHRARSVNDFDTQEGLRVALKRGEAQVASADVGRESPRSLRGTTLGLCRDDDSQSECSTVFEQDTEADWMLSNFDEETSRMQTLDEELNRLLVLKNYLILDSAEREAKFERLTGLAARIFHAPIALVSVVDLGRQWFMSTKGLGDAKEVPRNLTFCAHVIVSTEDVLVVPDATKDPRFRYNPFVTGPGHVRFYAGAPLVCPEGYRLGTLCVVDTEVRPEGLNPDERQTLRDLAALAVDAMVELRREKLNIEHGKCHVIASTAHDLLTPLNGIQISMPLLMEDEDLKPHLSSSHRNAIATASLCADVMSRICREAIETFRGEMTNRFTALNGTDPDGMQKIVVAELVKNVNMVLELFPKKVPLLISVDPLVPRAISVLDDLKVFRSMINYLTNALKNTEKGNVHLKLYVGDKTANKPSLVFECEDTGPELSQDDLEYFFSPLCEGTGESECFRCVGADGLPVVASVGTCCETSMSNLLGLGLYSVATQISSIGGDYGFQRLRDTISPADPDGSKATGTAFGFPSPSLFPVPSVQQLDDSKVERAL